MNKRQRKKAAKKIPRVVVYTDCAFYSNRGDGIVMSVKSVSDALVQLGASALLAAGSINRFQEARASLELAMNIDTLDAL